MSEKLFENCDEIKTIVVKTKGTPTQKLLAILAAAGIDDTAELAQILGVTDRYIRKARNQSSGTIGPPEPEFRNQSSEIGTRVPEERNQSSAEKKVSPTPPSKNNYHLEQPLSSNSTIAARGVAAAPLPMDAKVLEKRVLEACNGSLANPASFPGLMSMATPMMWLDHGADLERDVIPALTVAGKKNHGKNIRSWDYFTPMVAEAKAKRELGLPAVNIAENQLDKPKKSRTLADALAARLATTEVAHEAR